MTNSHFQISTVLVSLVLRFFWGQGFNCFRLFSMAVNQIDPAMALLQTIFEVLFVCFDMFVDILNCGFVYLGKGFEILKR